MSHFTVLVIGEDVEKQLAPFHEFECTGVDDEFIQDVDITEECIAAGTDEGAGAFDLQEALEYHGLENKVVASESEVDREDKHKYRYAVVQDGKLVKAVLRTNPNAKWDWWVVGGRWEGMFQLKSSTKKASSALKKDIDFVAMRNIAGETAAKKYDKAVALMCDSLHYFETWDNCRDVLYKDDIKKARDVYNSQVAVQTLTSDEEFAWGTSPEEFLCTREEYVQQARNMVGATFAVLKDGQWYTRGEIGWWGCVVDEKDKDTWYREFSALVDVLPDATLLTVVDCHI